MSGILQPANSGNQTAWAKALRHVGSTRQSTLYVFSNTPQRVFVALLPGRDPDTVVVRLQRQAICSPATVQQFARSTQLTRRETQVLELLVQGCVPSDVAAIFDTGIATVRSQIKAILLKCRLGSIRELLDLLGRIPSLDVLSVCFDADEKAIGDDVTGPNCTSA